MGYANPQQTAAGIHTRLYSRAFIVDDGKRRVVFVTADIGMVSQRLRLEVTTHTHTHTLFKVLLSGLKRVSSADHLPPLPPIPASSSLSPTV